ncbi:F-box protein SKIP14-like [Diospyros lotus]|uniref:F-box protein SKIP14-like n=1 Tax=Diospyros lotus TaxID=55363 RepID=UPI00225ABD6B|nr:F-box protein SKIP14-like [Diospyros lotus]
MALNFSHRPIFPARLSEDNLVSPMRIANGCLMEGIPERGGDGFASPWHSNRDVEDCFDYGTGRDRGDRSGSPESVSKDIIDLLPSDPFGMDISTTVTALTGWLEDLEVDYGGYGRDNRGNSRGEYNLFAAGLNFIWNKAVQFQAFPGNVYFGHKSNTVYQTNGCAQEKREANAMSQAGFGKVPVVQDVMNFVDETASSSAGRGIHESCAVAENCSDGDSGAPHPALFFALGFLGVRDLLSVERVCSSFCSTVRSDPLLWRRIHIGQPLNERITDDVLLQLTSRAQGNLQCLSLLECPRITDDGLKHVLENNPRLTKLSVPGCTRLSIEGIVNNLKALKSKGTLGIKHLRIGGRYGITDEQFEELKLLLGTDIHIEEKAHKPRFYHRGNHYLSCDDDRAIDIEICPKCQKLRLVYDCPAEGCQEKADSTQACRACKLCIPRCVQCGHCISDSEYEETFCLEWLCSDCSNRSPKRADSRDVVHGHSENVILQEPDYNYCFHG